MNEIEWDDFFNWVRALFPNWKSGNVETSVAWYGELKGFDLAEIKMAAKRVMTRQASAFPPSVFEIKSEVESKMFPKLHAEEAWELAISGKFDKETVPPAFKKTYQAIVGGRDLGYVQFEELVWIRKDFINFYKTLEEDRPQSIMIGYHETPQIDDKAKTLIKGIIKRLEE